MLRKIWIILIILVLASPLWAQIIKPPIESDIDRPLSFSPFACTDCLSTYKSSESESTWGGAFRGRRELNVFEIRELARKELIKEEQDEYENRNNPQ